MSDQLTKFGFELIGLGCLLSFLLPILFIGAIILFAGVFGK